MAPGAKVAFTDYTLIQDRVAMFESAYTLGARIHTNSWGSSIVDNSYTAQSLLFDSISYLLPDFLILFAASNDGEWSQYGATVGAPSTCKNCLSVGAAVGSLEDAQASGEFPRLIIGDTEVPCSVDGNAATLHFSGSSIFLQDYCQDSRSLTGLIAVVDLENLPAECSLLDQVLRENIFDEASCAHILTSGPLHNLKECNFCHRGFARNYCRVQSEYIVSTNTQRQLSIFILYYFCGSI